MTSRICLTLDDMMLHISEIEIYLLCLSSFCVATINQNKKACFKILENIPVYHVFLFLRIIAVRSIG